MYEGTVHLPATLPPPLEGPEPALLGDPANVADLLASDGALLLRGVISAGTAAAAAREVDAALEVALHEIAQAAPDDQHEAYIRHFREVQTLNSRWDLRVELSGALRQAVLEAMGTLGPLAAEVLTEDAQLCELACLVSDPGAMQQPLHADSPHCGQGCLLTMFIALQNIEKEMGGTIVLTGSNTPDAFQALAAGGPMGPKQVNLTNIDLDLCANIQVWL